MSKKSISDSGLVIYQDKNLAKLQKKLKSLEKEFSKKEDEYRELIDYIQEFENYIRSFVAEKISFYEELQNEFENLKSSNQSDIDKSEIEELLKKLNEVKSENNENEINEKDNKEERERQKKNYKASEDSELEELKSTYRKASKLIHPDIIREEDREEATQLFQELNRYYSEKNLLKVREIYRRVSSGTLFQTVADQKLDLKLLKSEIKHLQEKIDEIEFAIMHLEAQKDSAPRAYWDHIADNFDNDIDNDIKELEKDIRKLKRELNGDFRVPKAMKEKFEAVISLTDKVAENFAQLDDEYKFLFRKLVAQISRKRDKPLSSGMAKSWASGVITVVSISNDLNEEFLGDVYKLLKVTKSSAKTYENMVVEIVYKNLGDYEHSHKEINSFKEILNTMYQMQQEEI